MNNIERPTPNDQSRRILSPQFALLVRDAIHNPEEYQDRWLTTRNFFGQAPFGEFVELTVTAYAERLTPFLIRDVEDPIRGAITFTSDTLFSIRARYLAENTRTNRGDTLNNPAYLALEEHEFKNEALDRLEHYSIITPKLKLKNNAESRSLSKLLLLDAYRWLKMYPLLEDYVDINCSIGKGMFSPFGSKHAFSKVESVETYLPWVSRQLTRSKVMKELEQKISDSLTPSQKEELLNDKTLEPLTRLYRRLQFE